MVKSKSSAISKSSGSFKLRSRKVPVPQLINENDDYEAHQRKAFTNKDNIPKKRGRKSKFELHQIELAKEDLELSVKYVDQADYRNNQFFPSQPMDYPKWALKDDPKVEDEEQKRQEYVNNGLVPFFNTVRAGQLRPANVLIDLDDLRDNMKSVKYAVEKPNLLTKEEQNAGFGSFGGQNIQAKTDGQIYRGLYFQDAYFIKPKLDQTDLKEYHHPKHFFKAEIVKVDSDDTGHYIAYMNELYSGKPAKKYYFGGVEGEIDVDRANRFHAKQIVSSLSFQRNKAIKDAIELSLSEAELKEEFKDKDETYSPLAYRTSAGEVKDLSVSEEQLAIAHVIANQKVFIKANIVESEKPFKWEYQGQDLDETKNPIIYFRSTGKDQVKHLDSDTLLLMGVERLGLEPDSVQNLLEGLYQQGWINYPRADTIKAEDEPIKLLRNIEDFKGTDHERKLLLIIDESDKAVQNNEAYIQNGYWILKQGDTILKTKGFKVADEPSEYSEKSFDITIDKGIDPVTLTKFLADNNVGTPATRTTIFRALKEAGIVSLDKNRKYQLDRRGSYFAGAYEFFDENDIELGMNLKKQLDETDDIKEMENIIDSFDVVDRINLSVFIKRKGDLILETQSDLAILESY